MRKSLSASAARSVPSRADYRGPESGCGPNSSVEGWLPRPQHSGPCLQPAKLGILRPYLVEPTVKAAIAYSCESGQTGHNTGIGVMASHHPRLQRTVFSDRCRRDGPGHRAGSAAFGLGVSQPTARRLRPSPWPPIPPSRRSPRVQPRSSPDRASLPTARRPPPPNRSTLSACAERILEAAAESSGPRESAIARPISPA